MCGRFVRYVSVPEAADVFNAEAAAAELKPSYNITPGQDIAVIVNNGRNILIPCRWGFIPSWAKEPAVGYKMINTRAETITEKASFKSAFKRQRCLIIANGFYEWRKDGKKRTPFYIHLKNRNIFGFAGLYNVWNSPEGARICTTTIITTAANEFLGPIHNRMPDIIPRDKERLWLDPAVEQSEKLLALLRPYPSGELEFSEVSGIVNSSSHDSPDCISPVVNQKE